MAVVAVAAVVVAAVLPWTLSGTVARTSFATARSARLLGLAEHPAAAAALAAWFLVPAVAGVVPLALLLRRDRVAGVASAVVGAGAVIAAVAVLGSPLPTGAGVPLALVAGPVALGAGVALMARPPSPTGRARRPDR